MLKDAFCLVCNRHACGHIGSRPQVLSGAELRVIDLAAAGGTNKDIACELNTSENVVKVRLSRIYRKLRIERAGNARVHLSHWARQHSELFEAVA